MQMLNPVAKRVYAKPIKEEEEKKSSRRLSNGSTIVQKRQTSNKSASLAFSSSIAKYPVSSCPYPCKQ